MNLGLAVGPLPTGAVGDDYGRRRMFGAGAFGLAASSVAAALAQDTTALVLARIGQGLAVAAILSSGLGLIGHAFPPGPRRLQATGVWGACLGAGIASGPLLAGALDAGLGWRSAYWLITVLSAVLGALSWLLLTESSAERRHPVDLCGMLLLGAALVSVLAGLVEGRAGWGRPLVVGLLAVSVVLGGVFAVVALHRPTPMLDLRLFARPDFARATIAALATGAGVIAIMPFLPTLVQSGLGHNAFSAAVTLFGWSATSVLTALLAFRLPASFSARTQLVGGLLGVGGGRPC